MSNENNIPSAEQADNLFYVQFIEGAEETVEFTTPANPVSKNPNPIWLYPEVEITLLGRTVTLKLPRIDLTSQFNMREWDSKTNQFVESNASRTLKDTVDDLIAKGWDNKALNDVIKIQGRLYSHKAAPQNQSHTDESTGLTTRNIFAGVDITKPSLNPNQGLPSAVTPQPVPANPIPQASAPSPAPQPAVPQMSQPAPIPATAPQPTLESMQQQMMQMMQQMLQFQQPQVQQPVPQPQLVQQVQQAPQQPLYPWTDPQTGQQYHLTYEQYLHYSSPR